MNKGITYITCEYCGKEYEVEYPEYDCEGEDDTDDECPYCDEEE